MMSAAYLRYIMRDPSTQTYKRGVAQPGSAPPWGGGGRRFKSSRPDQHPCRGVRIPSLSSSMTPVVRRLRVEPSRPDQSGYSCAPFLAPGYVSPAAMHTCGWLTHENLVVCAPRTMKKLIAGGSAPAPWVSFLCSCKEKKPKESTPPGLRPPTTRVPSRRVCLRGCAYGASLRRMRTLAIPRSPLRAHASASLGARLDQGGIENTFAYRFEVGCTNPRSARRVPQPHRGLLSETVFEPEARGSAPGELVERPVGRGTEGDVARSGVCFFWFLFFAQAKKRNLPWVSHPQVAFHHRRRRFNI
jgi:hypothetical protein